MSDENLNDVKRLLRWATILAVVTIMAIVFDRLTGCSTEVSRKIDAPTPPPPTDTGTGGDPVTCDGGLEAGDTREEACQGGKIVYVCSADGKLKKAVDTCNTQPPACGAQTTTFAAVQPILTRSCNGCHRDHDSFGYAKDHAADYLRRFRLAQNVPGHMPQGATLTAPEVSTFASWIDDGLCPKPTGGEPQPGAFYSFDDTEQTMLTDVTNTAKVEVNDRVNVSYLVFADQINAGASVATLNAYTAAAVKTINSVSADRALEPAEEVGPGVLRIRKDRLGIDAAEWKRIEDADLVNIESKTSKGSLLKLLTATRKPWLHVESFTDVVLRNAAVYYDLLETPSTFDALVAQLGVNYAADLAARRDVVMSAFVGSPLSPHNRMVSVHTRSRDGQFWATYDTGPALGGDAEKNFTNFPLLGDIGGVLNGQFIAGEIIYTLPNGLHGYALFNAKQTFKAVPRVDAAGQPVLEQVGVDAQGKPILKQVIDQVFVRSDLDRLQNVAPVNVVRDFLNPTSSEISAGVSCFRCHASGILPIRDQTRAHVIANGAQFGADKDLILKVYKTQPEMDTVIKRENDHYLGVLSALRVAGLSAADEPISIAEDAHLLPWSFQKVCATLWLRSGECRVALNQSATAVSQWGQLLSGSGSITFDQFTQSLQQVIVELRLFEDPL